MKKLIAAALLALVSIGAHAAEEGAHLDNVLINMGDRPSLQRGARIFSNYCLSCHSAEYMRYNRMAKDLGIPDDLVKKDLMFASDRIGDLMTITMPHDLAKKWFGTAPPDLSLVARARGPQWLYTYLRSFYIDPDSSTGWNNTVFKNVAMPNALYELQGSQKAVFRTVTETVDGKQQKLKQFDHFELATPGTLTPAQYDDAMRDLTNFLVYVGEPAKLVRYRIGFWVVLFMVLLSVLGYLLKKEYWKDVH